MSKLLGVLVLVVMAGYMVVGCTPEETPIESVAQSIETPPDMAGTSSHSPRDPGSGQ